MKENDLVSMTIIDNGMNMEGVAKFEQLPVFVPYALKGEEVDAKVLKVNKNYALAKLVNIRLKSKERSEPDCDVYYECGSCNARHISYKEGLNIKKRNLENVLRKQAIVTSCIKEMFSMGIPYYYRNKLQFPVVEKKDGMHMGMYMEQSHKLIECNDCLIINKEIARVANELFKLLQKAKFKGYNEKNGSGDIRNIIVRIGMHTGEIMCVLVVNNRELVNSNRIKEVFDSLVSIEPNVKSFVLVVNTSRNNTILTDDTHVVFGNEYITEQIGDYSFNISANSFFQVNSVQAEVLYNVLKERLGLNENKCDTLVELYSGVGSIGIYMSNCANSVIGVEIVKQAVEASINNCKINKVTNANYLCMDANEAIKKMVEEKQKIDVLIVDPPRKGIELTGIQAILESNAKKIGYVSCNPATLARDLKLLSSKYNLQSIDMIDMFPYTSHVESVAVLVDK